ncbi:hypothetical protein SJI19_16575 [Acerihabitans sp. TG2]|uniref:hypothetical protein n=1 Tax=Acerihabitans sp. TG2 TaxID=3096008 RepID=UPI002B22C3F7|nr:hypothetical protein [Acerihabitans sp. TG2]MEA9392140.1 hypothetical protein [Acerihabitans sp. TG2]
MKLHENDFRGTMTALYSSDGKEALSSRQSNLVDYSSTLKSALQLMPPDVVQDMVADYKPLPQEKISNLMNSLISKELMLEDIAQGNNLDKEWVSSDSQQERSQPFSSSDEWNDNDWSDLSL